jgi:hypothetical protein
VKKEKKIKIEQAAFLGDLANFTPDCTARSRWDTGAGVGAERMLKMV